MNGRYFLDTNILAYCFDPSATDKRTRSNQLVREGREHRSAVISYQVVQEFINLALRKFKPQMTVDEVRRYSTSVLRPMVAVNSSIALTLRALEVTERYKFSWYDSLLIAAALDADCETLYSEDLHHLQRIETLQIVNPFR